MRLDKKTKRLAWMTLSSTIILILILLDSRDPTTIRGWVMAWLSRK